MDWVLGNIKEVVVILFNCGFENVYLKNIQQSILYMHTSQHFLKLPAMQLLLIPITTNIKKSKTHTHTHKTEVQDIALLQPHRCLYHHFVNTQHIEILQNTGKKSQVPCGIKESEESLYSVSCSWLGLLGHLKARLLTYLPLSSHNLLSTLSIQSLLGCRYYSNRTVVTILAQISSQIVHQELPQTPISSSISSSLYLQISCLQKFLVFSLFLDYSSVAFMQS